jgi:hypothetical protein
MGSLGGHLIPGSFFIIFSIWWSYITSIRYFQCKHTSNNNKARKYESTVTKPCVCLPCYKHGRLPIESYFKLVATLIGITIEFIFGFEYAMPSQLEHEEHVGHGEHQNKREMINHMNNTNDMKVLIFTKNNLQHMCMYSSFLFGSIIEIMMANRKWLPPKLDFIFGVVSFLIEALLFIFHLHGRSVLDVHVHTLLVLSILGCLLFTCLEIYNSREIFFTYGRVGCTLLQGILFCQIGFILYPPKKLSNFLTEHNMTIQNEHDLVMTITALFCFNIFAIMFYLLFMGYMVKKCFIDWKLFESQWDDLMAFDDELNKNKDFIGIELNGFLPLKNEEDDNEV